ncbi:helix-turn-helix transcriptional regulator [Streptomyces sp. SL294]|uniref:helix-turn-helix domain-containing protein n=1 Tax=Streptomyces sp. SL294 TaxID=2995144 RepID=UPI0022734091|nr:MULTISPECIES: helix-turn-helix transcriptional regulator [unclassified Streptomyces]MCY1653026.1 helix-turn-helix transcriptional regulator [Streptomyces sp. SL203]MCY1679752.1 helix-turn-helix transcriptional regulator [Streptomyces sp. SL294]
MTSHHRPRTARVKYGEELRLGRTAAGLTQEALSEQIVCSPTLISHFEAGRRLPNPDDAQRIDRALSTDGFFARWLEDLDTKFAEHFAAVAELEQQATDIRQYGASLIPGLLQTNDYARAVFKAHSPNFLADEVDSLIVNRAARARILDNSLSPTAWTLLDEAALRRPVGGPQVMAEQLRKIAGLADSGRIRLHVVPFSVGAHALMESMLYLLSFSDAAPVAYVEGLHTGKLIDDPTVVESCKTAYALALSDAAPHHESLALVRVIAEEYENGER